MAVYNPLAEKAYEFMLRKITDGEFSAGEYYSETKLAQDLGISRTPMRDALMRLSQDRYIDIVPNKGFRLHEMTEEDIQNTFQVRAAIEGFCSMALHDDRKTKRGRRVIEDLADTLDDMKRAIEEGKSFEEILSYDFDFHRQIVEYSNNADMIRLINSYSHMQQDIARKTFELEGRPMEAYNEHMEIYHCLTSENEGARAELYEAVVRHMESSRDIALRDCEISQTA